MIYRCDIINTMKRLLSWSIGIALLLVTFVAPPLLLADNNLPQPNDDFYLLDQANFFSASASAQFIANSKELAQQTGTQIVTVLILFLRRENRRPWAERRGEIVAVKDSRRRR